MSPAALAARSAWWQSHRRRARLRTRPLIVPAYGGRQRLPGTTAGTVLREAPDAYRRPCGLVLGQATGHVSGTLELRPEPGPSLDDAWLVNLTTWLALPDSAPDLAQCAVVIETGAPGQRAVRLLVHPTWCGRGARRAPDLGTLAIDAGTRMPHLVRSLSACGVGRARPLPAREVAAVVREAYHPGRGSVINGGREPWSGAAPGSALGSAPGGHAERWQHFHHGSHASLTWLLTRAPASALSSLLAHVAAVRPGGARLRLTLLHRPVGDAPPPLAPLVTVTAPAGPGELEAAAAAVVQAFPPGLRPWLRSLYGSQAAAFAAGLPAGTLFTAHAAPPALLAAE